MRLVLGLCLVAYLIHKADTEELAPAIGSLNIWNVMVGVALLLASVVGLEAVRMHLVFKGHGLSIKTSLQHVLTGLFFTNLFGSMLAGDAWRARKLSALGLPPLIAFGLLAVLRAIAVLVLILTLGAWAIAKPDEFMRLLGQLDFVRLDRSGLIVLGLAVGGALAATFYWRGRWRSWLPGFFTALRTVPVMRWAAAAALSVVIVVVRAASLAFFVTAQNHDLGLLAPIPVMALVGLSSIVPIAPANLGVREGVFVLGLQSIGVPFFIALLAALLNRLALMLFSVAGLAEILRQRRAKPVSRPNSSNAP